jgi:cholesterol oxidase
MSNEHFDAVIIGSGFGGSVMAYRLAEAGLSVCVLERGQPFPPGSFPRSPHGMHRNFWDPSDGLFGMFNLWSFRNLGALVSSGLGGGSLIYANVLLRKDEKWFVREDGGQKGFEYWPITRAELDPHYDRAERVLNAQRYPFEHSPYDKTQKTRAMQFAARKLELEWMLPPLAVTFSNPGETPVPGEPIREEYRNLHDRTRYTCRLCAECDIGCNYGSKNTLDYNYLSHAKRLGAELRTLCDVSRFAPRSGGSGYEIRYRQHTVGERTPRGAPLQTVTADHLVLAAGTLGSTFLLLKNRAAFPGLSGTLGSRFCGNGDLLTFAIRSGVTVDGKRMAWALDGTRGPVITSAIRMADAADGASGRGFYIEDAGYPAFIGWIMETAGGFSALRRLKNVAWLRLMSALGISKDTNFSGELAYILGAAEFSSSSLPMLGMGRDIADGKLALENDLLECDWNIRRSSEYFTRLRDTMKRIADVWDADFKDNALWHLNRRVITVHPLGGAPLGRTVAEGVVDVNGEVFGYPGLIVADGSVLPGPVGANPALTIAALSDRFADSLLERRGASLAARRVQISGVVGESPVTPG